MEGVVIRPYQLYTGQAGLPGQPLGMILSDSMSSGVDRIGLMAIGLMAIGLMAINFLEISDQVLH